MGTRKPKLESSANRPVTFDFCGDEFFVVSGPLVPVHRLPALTGSELQILRELLCGKTYSEIARRRRRSRHTVANQVASILRKYRVGSRRELTLAIDAL
jgi:DNA-binding CsgD family transcriptional regulator